MHTKFAGSHVKQIYWMLGGVGSMFLVSLLNYQVLLERAHWFYIAAVASLMMVLVFGQKYLGARRWVKLPGESLPAFRVGQADFNSRHGKIFRGLSTPRTFLG